MIRATLFFLLFVVAPIVGGFEIPVSSFTVANSDVYFFMGPEQVLTIKPIVEGERYEIFLSTDFRLTRTSSGTYIIDRRPKS